MKRFFALILLLPFALSAYTSPGEPAGFVNDFAGILSADTATSLKERLSLYEKETGNEIVVVTIPTHGEDETIETYATRLFEDWGIGKAEEDNGLLLLIARDDREMRIEVGYGLEPVVTDLESSFIIRDILTPAFQRNDFDGGVTGAVNKIIESIGGDVSSESSQSARSLDVSGFFYPAIFFLMVLGSVLGRSKSWWAGGVIGVVIGVVIGLFLGLIAGVIGVVVLSILGLLFDFLVSKAHSRHRDGGPMPPWFLGGGMGGGSGFGGGGFGGFGGGMSGGGGSSGRW